MVQGGGQEVTIVLWSRRSGLITLLYEGIGTYENGLAENEKIWRALRITAS